VSKTKRQEIKASERKTPFQALCHQDYEAAKDTEMSMTTGEMVIVMDNRASTDWWWAECPTRGAKGWVPVGFLTIDQETAEDQTKRIRTLSQSMKRGHGNRHGNRHPTSTNGTHKQPRTTLERKTSDATMGQPRSSSDDSRLVDENTFRTMMPVAEDRNIRKLFQKYDQNRSGTLIHEELSGMFSDAGLPCSAQEINEAMIRFKTFSFHSGDRSAGSAEATLVTLLTMKELMKTMKKKKYLKPNGTSSIPVTMLEFYNLWRFSREDSFTDVTRVTNRLCDLRIQLGGSAPCDKVHWCLVELL